MFQFRLFGGGDKVSISSFVLVSSPQLHSVDTVANSNPIHKVRTAIRFRLSDSLLDINYHSHRNLKPSTNNWLWFHRQLHILNLFSKVEISHHWLWQLVFVANFQFVFCFSRCTNILAQNRKGLQSRRITRNPHQRLINGLVFVRFWICWILDLWICIYLFASFIWSLEGLQECHKGWKTCRPDLIHVHLTWSMIICSWTMKSRSDDIWWSVYLTWCRI